MMKNGSSQKSRHIWTFMTVFANHHRTVWHAWQGGCHAGGCFHWRCCPHVHAIAGCIGDGLGTCHIFIAQRGHLWFLHVSGSYWSRCRGPVVPYVRFLLVHASYCGWVTCYFFIGPSVVFLLVHVAWPQYPACLSFTRPRVSMVYVHVSVFYWATCRALSYPHFFFWFDNMVGWICTTYFVCITRVIHWSSTCQILI